VSRQYASRFRVVRIFLRWSARVVPFHCYTVYCVTFCSKIYKTTCARARARANVICTIFVTETRRTDVFCVTASKRGALSDRGTKFDLLAIYVDAARGRFSPICTPFALVNNLTLGWQRFNVSGINDIRAFTSLMR